MSDSGGYPGGYGGPEMWSPQGPGYVPPMQGQTYPPGYTPYGVPIDPSVRSHAMAALITGCVATFVCAGPLAIPTAILGGVALGKADTDPEGARRLTKWAWIALGIGIGVAILAVVAYFLVILLIAGAAATSAVS